MAFIRRFMIEFGVLSSAFDLLTFGTLLGAFNASAELFRTGWFVESLLTELVVALVVRTRRRFYLSRPGRVLLVSTLVLVPAAFVIPWLPGAALLGFVPMPLPLMAALVAITAGYVMATEWLKASFFRRYD